MRFLEYVSLQTRHTVQVVRNLADQHDRFAVFVQTHLGVTWPVDVTTRADGYLRVEAISPNGVSRLWLVPPGGFLVADALSLTSWSSGSFTSVHSRCAEVSESKKES